MLRILLKHYVNNMHKDCCSNGLIFAADICLRIFHTIQACLAAKLTLFWSELTVGFCPLFARSLSRAAVHFLASWGQFWLASRCAVRNSAGDGAVIFRRRR